MGKLITLVARFAKHRTSGGSPTSQVPRSSVLELRRLLVFTWRGSWVTLVAPAVEKRHDGLCRHRSPGNVGL